MKREVFTGCRNAAATIESIQDFNIKFGIQTRVQLQALIDSSYSIQGSTELGVLIAPRIYIGELHILGPFLLHHPGNKLIDF